LREDPLVLDHGLEGERRLERLRRLGPPERRLRQQLRAQGQREQRVVPEPSRELPRTPRVLDGLVEPPPLPEELPRGTLVRTRQECAVVSCLHRRL
jgi:hypothetical protein